MGAVRIRETSSLGRINTNQIFAVNYTIHIIGIYDPWHENMAMTFFTVLPCILIH